MSDKTEVLNYLKKHKYITTLDAIKHIGTIRLGARIHELRQEGHHIVTLQKKVAKRGNKKATVAEYMLVRAA